MMDETRLLEQYPAPVRVDAAEVADRVRESGVTLIVLDDDPTGTQSVADLPVLTRWEQDDLVWALEQGRDAVYVLTNTRSLDAESAAARNREIVTAALAAAERLERRIAFVSRGDSTLRGHFPLETDVIAATLAELGGPVPDGVLIVPAFPDAGRVTIGGVHYYRQSGELVPVAETEFAKDATFGFRSSALPEWVEEKTKGRWAAADVTVLSLDIIRRGPEAVATVLQDAHDGQPIVVDVVIEDDIRIVALGLELAEADGKQFLYRVGPPFVRARIGQEIASPLAPAQLASDRVTGSAAGGLIVVGSHVDLTTRQLAALRTEHPHLPTVELSVSAIIDADARDAHLGEAKARVVEALASGDVILHTSRELVKTDDADASLAISRGVSSAVCEVVAHALRVTPPSFVIAKGGITSSDVATNGLEIRHAVVRGPMLPGIVSLWQAVGGPADGIPYVVFAGNVGDEDSLARVVEKFHASAAADVDASASAPASASN
ncbi:four-carbon acid sugar kinase family protein [Pseudoclavibacter sp. VKM Ac-2867]|uniref:four-carbon acid sugar kinase family protein n=1 Tax=Pseudoclavibacter sp. VKM Ac-2867 TaxID=2783829 RepID=UPI003A5C6B8A